MGSNTPTTREAFDAGYLAAEFECQRGNPIHGPSDETERDQAYARWQQTLGVS